MRGKASGLCGHAGGHGITPACAGKSSQNEICWRRPWDHPRVCGEKQSISAPSVGTQGSSPHVRGKGLLYLRRHSHVRITPACAGKRLHKEASNKLRLGITPAYAGKSSSAASSKDWLLGSPPHVRGKANHIHGGVGLNGITPACAGKSRHRRSDWSWRRDHPRMCGEKSGIACGRFRS